MALVIAWAGRADAQNVSPPVDMEQVAAASPEDPREIVVTAARRGEAEVAAESEFGDDEIAGQGSDSIEELLARLAPFIGGNGEEPVILINGKPAGFDRSILSYPPEALDRVAVLKPEAAAHYGEPAGKRVVNLVLKKNFAMLDADASADFATAGGQYGGTLSARRTAISGEFRWNIQARLGADSALRKDARNISPRDGVFDGIGFVTAPGGGEIDPALSLIAGRPVTAAGIPPGASVAMPGLDDFAATAGLLDPVDPNRFETLQSARRNAALTIGVTRPVGDFSVGFNVNASRNSGEGLRGLPMVSVLIPAGHSLSPFAQDVLLTRPFAGDRALRVDNDMTALSSSLTLNGKIGGWQTGLAVNYARGWSSNLLETGIDRARVQQATDADAGFNPYGVWDKSLLLATRSRTRSENLSARLNLRKAVAELPAGPMLWNFTANASRNRSHSRRDDGAAGSDARRRTRHQANGQMTLSVPVTRRGAAGPAWVGDLSLDLSVSTQAMTGSRAQKRYGADVSWSPWTTVQLRGSIERAEDAPSFDQLDAPVVTTVGRVFDYARQEVAEPLWVTGGNPDLRRGSRQGLALSAMIRPLGDELLTLDFGYRRSVAKRGVAFFPELTPAIEAAFPERVTRGADGRLLAVDARAINIARDIKAELSSSAALRLLPGRGGGEGEVATDPLQFSVALNHRWQLEDKLLTHPGLPVIDRLAGSGQSRHNLTLQVTAGKRGIGATLDGNWSNPATVASGDRSFRSKPPLLFNLALFIEPAQLFGRPEARKRANRFKFALNVQNLFNGYRRVTFVDGSVPAGYTRDEIDPLGRTVQLSVRRRF